MKKYLLYLVLFIFVPSCKGGENDLGEVESGTVRQPAFAGQFYSADSTILSKQIKIFLENAKPPTVSDAIAIIVPHAGYIYSGQIAADAYNQVKQNEYDLVVVLGTNHTTAGFSGISIYPNGAFATPIGMVEIDDK